jgi:heme A synthase
MSTEPSAKFARFGRFAQFAWITLGFNILVILWGAYVRISYSGDGCGDHWPKCNGELVPNLSSTKTLIEFSHRATSGIALLLVVALAVWAFRAFQRGNIVRKGAMTALLFIIIEALLGAGLVKFGLVNKNDSVQRAIVMSLHLVNTLILVGAVTATAWWATTGRSLQLRGQKLLTPAMIFMLFGTLVLGISGAITALGDTLFPATSLSEGMRQDFSPTAHILIRLRIWHPIIALTMACVSIFLAVWISVTSQITQAVKMARAVIGIYITQIILGFINLFLLAPGWMQIIHLLVADVLWVHLVMLAVATLSTVPGKIQESIEKSGEVWGSLGKTGEVKY